SQEVPDRLGAAKFNVFTLIILDQHFEARVLVVELEAQIGLGQGSRYRLAGFELGYLLGQIVRGPRIGRGEGQPWQPSADGLRVEQSYEGCLTDAAMPKDADALRPTQALSKDRHGSRGTEHECHPGAA